MSARIDVSVHEARAANALAAQAAVASIHAPSPPVVPVPGLFAPAAATQVIVAGAPHVTMTAFDQYLARFVDRAGAAINAYDVMNEENRQSLTVVPE